MAQLLEDRTAIVTGVGPGLGRDIALALAAEGANVVLAARNAERLAAVASEIAEAGGTALAVPTDITDQGECAALVGAAVEEFGALHTLVNSAFKQPPFEHLVDTSEDALRSGFEINFFAHMWMVRAAAPHLRAAAPASIVFINTMSTRRIRENFGVYTASKMALLGAAKALAVELGQDRIRVNSVHPGYIWGPSVKWYLNHQAEQRGVTFDDIYKEVAGDTAIHHLPGSDEIAQSVVFLASEKMSSSITGESIDVNAGQFIR